MKKGRRPDRLKGRDREGRKGEKGSISVRITIIFEKKEALGGGCSKAERDSILQRKALGSY